MVLFTIVTLSALGLIFGLGLAFASLKLKVDEDPTLKKILEMLPGLNCGACGKAGCSSFAGALLKHAVPVNGCLPGGEKVAKNLSRFLGMEEKEIQVKKAVIHCGTTFANRTKIAEYRGVQACSGAILLQGAGFACPYSCLGFGDCAHACPFGAITMKEGKPFVDYFKCTGCGLCVKTCPRQIISLEILKADRELVAVACRSLAKGPEVKKICNVGCIACKLCEKTLPEIFKVENNLARINYEKADSATGWNAAIKVCPQKTIVQLLSKEEVSKIVAK